MKVLLSATDVSRILGCDIRYASYLMRSQIIKSRLRTRAGGREYRETTEAHINEYLRTLGDSDDKGQRGSAGVKFHDRSSCESDEKFISRLRKQWLK